jgi:hypothetical protein
MVSLAKDAADAGNDGVTIQALGGIANPSTKDDTAVTAALSLRSEGNVSGGVKVANMIANPSTRDEVLTKLAK